MWNMDYIYDLPLVVKSVILIVGLDILLIAYWTSVKEERNEESERLSDEKSNDNKNE